MRFGQTARRLASEAADRHAVVYGATAGYAAWLTSFLYSDGRTTLVVTDSELEAARAVRDLGFFTPPESIIHIPAIDVSPYAELSPDRIALTERMAGLYRAAHTEAPHTVVVSATSLIRRVVLPRAMRDRSRTVTQGVDIDRDKFAQALISAGYTRTTIVEDPGTFAVRGLVVDVFPATAPYPVRIELFGDEVESIRAYDSDTQRTLRTLDHVDIHMVRDTIPTEGADPRAAILAAADVCRSPSTDTRRLIEQVDSGELFVGIETLTPAFHTELVPLWSYLPDDTAVILLDEQAIEQAITDELSLADARYHDRMDDHRVSFPPQSHYVSFEAFDAWRSARTGIATRRLELVGEDPGVRLSLADHTVLRADLTTARKDDAQVAAPLAKTIERYRKAGLITVLAVSSDTRATQLRGTLSGHGVEIIAVNSIAELPAECDVAIVPRALAHGFVSQADEIAVITEGDIFGTARTSSVASTRAAKRARAALRGGDTDFSSLAVGDHLVHSMHGVGRYLGLKKLPVAAPIDFLHLEYRGGSLYLPVYRMGELDRYVGADGHTPRLDSLGGASFAASRNKVRKHVQALAEELLQLYAQRALVPGFAFPAGDAMYRDFEATFEFEETPDQQSAINDVTRDMEREQPMDRLICGDVGYGKTEVALRAILKAALGGKQAVLLAPTTVLAEQHFNTMRDRFSGWPLTVGKLSRFQNKKAQADTVKKLATGAIDVVVGTHRVLSKDVRFSDLGLLVVDEEQRFGVAHKERIKKLRSHVDVLTLTATPIPRTLHMAMAGMRDLSIIATPPAERRSIRTFVARPEDSIIRDAVRQELARGGQVFFVAPRISANKLGDLSLDEWAEHITSLVPESVVSVAHGQMRADALERTMLQFIDGKSDVLCSTTIVESGLDIRRANTMLIANADKFGLAQLYQLRGRIGRSKVRAYCYLLVPSRGKVTDEARRRLETLQQFSDLGAGFAIASRDLEIRGAGELLGSKQSGSIAAIGFEAYTTMLEQAVADLKGEPVHRPSDPILNVEVAAYIPDELVSDTGQRLALYKNLSSAEDAEEISELLQDIEDRYGSLPDEVRLLGDLMVLKTIAKSLGATAVDLTPKAVTLTLSESSALDPKQVVQLIQEHPETIHMTPDMRFKYRFSEPTDEPVEAATRGLLEIAQYAT